MKNKRKKGWWRREGPYTGVWIKAHPEFDPRPRPVSCSPEVFQTLQVYNEYFHANCLWKRLMGSWICIQAEPPVEWMKGMEKGRAKLEIARMGLGYIWISTASPTQEARAWDTITAQGSCGALQIKPHENLTERPDRTVSGEGVALGNGATSTGSTAESLSLPTGSLRGSTPSSGPGESSSASVLQGSTVEMLVPTAVGPKLETEEQADIHKSARVKPSQGQVIQSVQAY